LSVAASFFLATGNWQLATGNDSSGPNHPAN